MCISLKQGFISMPWRQVGGEDGEPPAVLFLVESLYCRLAYMFYSKLCKIKFIIVYSMQRECIPKSIPFYCCCSVWSMVQILRLVIYKENLQPSLIIVVFNRQPPHNRGT